MNDTIEVKVGDVSLGRVPRIVLGGCPCCGATGVMPGAPGKGWMIQCTDPTCGMMTPVCAKQVDAAARWNRRPTATPRGKKKR